MVILTRAMSFTLEKKPANPPRWGPSLLVVFFRRANIFCTSSTFISGEKSSPSKLRYFWEKVRTPWPFRRV